MDQVQFTAIVEKYKPQGNDVTLDYARQSYRYIMLKMDGWWSVCECTGGTGTIYSKSMDRLFQFPVPDQLNTILVGEFLFGTNRAITSGKYQTFHAFDKVMSNESYMTRYGRAREDVDIYSKWIHDNPQLVRNTRRMYYVDIYDIAYLDYFLDYIKRNDIEGLVFRNDKDQNYLSRYKPKFTQDYVCMGYLEGKGKYEGLLGSILGGKYIDGKLTQVIAVGGGFTDTMRIDYWKQNNIGRVFEAEGRQLFPTGSLRHPTFLRWREDKTAEECIWPLKLI